MVFPDAYATLSVREAMDRIGLNLFPDHWTGKEYLDHWRLGLNPKPPTKQRGMAAVRVLLTLVWDGTVIVEAETSEGVYELIAAEDVQHALKAGNQAGSSRPRGDCRWHGCYRHRASFKEAGHPLFAAWSEQRGTTTSLSLASGI